MYRLQCVGAEPFFPKSHVWDLHRFYRRKSYVLSQWIVSWWGRPCVFFCLESCKLYCSILCLTAECLEELNNSMCEQCVWFLFFCFLSLLNVFLYISDRKYCGKQKILFCLCEDLKSVLIHTIVTIWLYLNFRCSFNSDNPSTYNNYSRDVTLTLISLFSQSVVFPEHKPQIPSDVVTGPFILLCNTWLIIFQFLHFISLDTMTIFM